MAWSSIILLTIAVCVFWNGSAILRNRKLAKTMGVPIVTGIFSSQIHIWSILLRILGPVLDKLHCSRWTKYDVMGWCFHDKYKAHEELGKIFVHVTADAVELYIADAPVCDHLQQRRKDFLKQIEVMEPANLFGMSVATVEGTDWQRHRKIVSSQFTNERNNSFVWKDTLQQANEMMEYWKEKTVSGFNSVHSDSLTLGLHVLSSASFGHPHHFRDSTEAAKDGYSLNYKDCLRIILGNIPIVALINMKPFCYLPKLPGKAEKFRVACKEFKRNMVEMVQAERAQVSQGTEKRGNLLATLVKQADEAEKKKSGGLTDDEIYGNIFMFTLAGHETTANAIAYAIYLLVAFPQWQDWAAEEVNLVMGTYSDDDISSSYEEIFPKLKRCLAVLYETMRLYGPLPTIMKHTGNQSQILKVEGREIIVPPQTDVYVNQVALHTLPCYWGADSLSWKPGRWIKGATSPSDLSSEEIITPIKGSFTPWADGPRVCPGKKFAQVEFVGVIASLLRKYSVQAIPDEGESVEQVQARVYGVVEDSAQRLTVAMLKPTSVSFRLVERQKGN